MLGTFESVKPLPLAGRFFCRNGLLQKDTVCKNIILEKGDEGPYVAKRPGLRPTMNLTGLGISTNFQGMTALGAGTVSDSDVLVIMGDYLVSLNKILQGLGLGALSALPLTGGAGTQTAGALYECANVVTVSSVYAILQSSQFVFLYGYVGAGIWSKVATAASQPLVPSICELNGTFYVMDKGGRIWASELNNPGLWPVLNYVALGDAVGSPVRLAIHLNYLVAFCTDSITMYYDAAISPGAPIAKVTSAIFTEGTSSHGAKTVQEMDDVMYWLGGSSVSGFIVYRMRGLTIEKISTPTIERLLTKYFAPADADAFTLSQVTFPSAPIAYTTRAGGHSFYILTSPAYQDIYGTQKPGITLSFDTDNGEWHWWTQVSDTDTEREFGLGGALPMRSYGTTAMPHLSTGQIYTMDDTYYRDGYKVINVQVQTKSESFGNQRVKILPATYLQASTGSTAVSVSWSDDDYATFSAPRTLSLATSKKQMIRCGSMIERAWKITHTDNTSLQLYNIQPEVQPGAL